MSHAAERVPTLSLEEYLTFEDLSEVRHEFVGGRVYAMAGASLRHAMLVQLINARLLAAFLPAGCRVHTHDTKLRTPGGAVYYPDVYVRCGRPEHRLYDVDAEWVVEVLSPSTEITDDREKAEAYRHLPSLRGYLLAHPDYEWLELRTPTEIGWHVVRTGTGYVDVGPVRIDAREIFEELDRLVPRETEIP